MLRIVIDTNILISSRLGNSKSPLKTLVENLIINHSLLSSPETIAELRDVLYRKKFDKYLTDEGRNQFVNLYEKISYKVTIVENVSACRDSQDDKFLELAVNGEADIILTGDNDLLELDPFRNIRIISPRKFLNLINS